MRLESVATVSFLCCFAALCLTTACLMCFLFFFFNDTATTEIYTLSLHDALPICRRRSRARAHDAARRRRRVVDDDRIRSQLRPDRKSTRLNSSHLVISYAVFCLKKKKKNHTRCLHM